MYKSSYELCRLASLHVIALKVFGPGHVGPWACLTITLRANCLPKQGIDFDVWPREWQVLFAMVMHVTHLRLFLDLDFLCIWGWNGRRTQKIFIPVAV